MLEHSIAHEIAVLMIRRHLELRLRIKGYTKEQSVNLVSKLGDGQIIQKLEEFWTKWGPTIIAITKVVLALLPLLLIMEVPKGTPQPTLEEFLDD